MAEHGVVRRTPFHGGFDGVDVVDALADERSFAEQVLVEVGRRSGVGVHAGRAREDVLEPGALAAHRQRHRHPWLNDAIPGNNAAPFGVELRPVERVRCAADELGNGIAGHPRVGVKCNDVPDAAWQGRRCPVERHERGSRLLPDQTVQFLEFAALPFPAHPRILGRIPLPAPVQQVEAWLAASGIATVQLGDAFVRLRQQALIVLDRLRRRIAPVGEEGEEDVRTGIAQIMHFDRRHEIVDGLGAAEQGGHDDQRALAVGDAGLEIKSRQRLRSEHRRDHPVEETGSQLRCRDDAGDDEQRHEQPWRSARGCHENRGGEHERRRRADQGDVARNAEPEERRTEPFGHRRPIRHIAAELRRAPADQPVAWVGFGGGEIASGLGQGKDTPRDIELGQARATGDVLDLLPVRVAGGEIEGREARAVAEERIDQADALEDLAPVDCGDLPHARDDVADGHVHGGLLLVLGGDQRFGAGALPDHLRIEPFGGGRSERSGIAEPVGKLDEKRRRVIRPKVAQRVGDRHRICPPEAQRAVGYGVGAAAKTLPLDDLLGRAAEVLDQHDAKRDRHGPQFTDRQRLDALIRVEHPAQRVDVEAAVHVRDIRPGDAEHPRQTGKVPALDTRQLAVVAGREVALDLEDLLLDDMVVVEDPFRCWGDGAPVLDDAGDRPIGREQRCFIVAEPGRQRMPSAGRRVMALGVGKRGGVLRQPVQTELLGADQFLAMPQRLVLVAPQEPHVLPPHQRVDTEQLASMAPPSPTAP